MPSSLTHHIFAEVAFPLAVEILPSLKDHRDLIAVGTQGPDLFFFYGLVPWRRRSDASTAHRAGSALHDMDPMHLFPVMWKKLAEQPLDQQGMLASYLYGTMLHYLLDRTVHPYVYYRTGFNSLGELKAPFGYDHARLETQMDVALLTYLQKDKAHYHPSHTLEANRVQMAQVGEFYAKLGLFEVKPHHWLNGWEDMMAIKNFLYSRRSPKYHVIKSLTSFDSLIRANLYPLEVDLHDPLDHLNLTHQTWRNPTTGQSSTQSMPDLFDEALLQVEQMATLASRQWHHPQHDMSDEWQDFFKSIDHDGNIVGQTRQFFHSMYRQAAGAE